MRRRREVWGLWITLAALVACHCDGPSSGGDGCDVDFAPRSDGSTPKDPCEQVSVPQVPRPSACATVPRGVPYASGSGWLIAASEPINVPRPPPSQAIDFAQSFEVTEFDEGLTRGRSGSIDLGVVGWAYDPDVGFALSAPKGASARVGDRWVTSADAHTFVITGPPDALAEAYHFVDLPASSSFAALDATRVAALGLGGTLELELSVLDVVSGTEERRFVSLGSAADRREGPAPAGIGEVLALDSEHVLIAWATNSGASAAVIDVERGVTAGPVEIVRDPRVFVPVLARLSPTVVGVAWTGTSGTEVRFRTLPADLQGVQHEDGSIVNPTTDCAQSAASIAADGTGRALITWGETVTGPFGARWVSPDGLEELFEGSPCARASGAPILAARPGSILGSWSDRGFTQAGDVGAYLVHGAPPADAGNDAPADAGSDASAPVDASFDADATVPGDATDD